jgi:hypothetical protein
MYKDGTEIHTWKNTTWRDPTDRGGNSASWWIRTDKLYAKVHFLEPEASITGVQIIEESADENMCFGKTFNHDNAGFCAGDDIYSMVRSYGQPWEPARGSDEADEEACDAACSKYDECTGYLRRFGREGSSIDANLQCSFKMGALTTEAADEESLGKISCVEKSCAATAKVLCNVPTGRVDYEGETFMGAQGMTTSTQVLGNYGCADFSQIGLTGTGTQRVVRYRGPSAIEFFIKFWPIDTSQSSFLKEDRIWKNEDGTLIPEANRGTCSWLPDCTHAFRSDPSRMQATTTGKSGILLA